METVDIYNELMDYAGVQEFGSLKSLLVTAADKLEELDERVSIMSAQPDVIALLKEQEPVKPIKFPHSITYPGSTYICGNCKISILEPDDNFCPNCGRAVKWDD